jgi:hypothetical protein
LVDEFVARRGQLARTGSGLAEWYMAGMVGQLGMVAVRLVEELAKVTGRPVQDVWTALFSQLDVDLGYRLPDWRGAVLCPDCPDCGGRLERWAEDCDDGTLWRCAPCDTFYET